MAGYQVFKYDCDPRHDHVVMPKGARILSIQTQHDTEPHNTKLWAIVDPDAPMVRRLIWAAGTGHALPSGDPGRFIGTVQYLGGALVFHFFDSGEAYLS